MVVGHIRVRDNTNHGRPRALSNMENSACLEDCSDSAESKRLVERHWRPIRESQKVSMRASDKSSILPRTYETSGDGLAMNG
jgi:hypothetical protein